MSEQVFGMERQWKLRLKEAQKLTNVPNYAGKIYIFKVKFNHKELIF